ncbi:MAG: hypothetical protein KGL90_05485 [Burkholderiales bacterium]|nr:hypothetical protein [Burkholderiales bacterium]
MRVFLFSLAIAALTAAGAAHATNYSLWINGRAGGGAMGANGNYADFTYWGGAPSGSTSGATVDAGINKISVNWDGYSHVSDTNNLVRNALDCYCTGSNWCYVAAHSAGNLQIGYALSLYGSSTRNVKTPGSSSASDASGTCTNVSGNTTQKGWNLKFVDVAAGAAGGSELADSGSWATAEPLVQDLKTSTARAMYNHNTTQAVSFYMYAGAKGAITSAVLKGQNDSIVSYHSSGGVSGSSGASYCNPADYFCNDLTMGTAANEGGSSKWSFHSVVFRDDSEIYDHYANKNWEGVVSVVRTHMINTAK